MLKKNVSLTEDQEKICRLMGTPKEEFMRALNSQKCGTDLVIKTRKISEFEASICKILGVTEDAYLKAYEKAEKDYKKP